MKKRFSVLVLFLLFIAIKGFAQAPVADFSANTTTGCGTLIVTFTDLTTNNPTSWLWNFGDGGTSTIQNPTHAYVAPGTYTVTLKATNSQGNNTIVKTAYIHVFALPTPSFSAAPLSGCSPLAVHFTNTSTPGDAPINQWLWDFGDGATSSAQSPTHTYTASGNFTVALQVTDQNGCSNSFSITNYVHVGLKPVAGFTSQVPSACNPPVNVHFTNTTIPGSVTSTWTFGDGGTSTQFSPTHGYNNPGTYTVTLIVSQNGCTDTITHTVTITTSPFTAQYSASPLSGCSPLTVTFHDLSTPAPNSWSWTFGDGGTSTAQNPSHTYSAPGTYTATLISANGSGCSDTVVHTITVYGPPNLSFTGNPILACLPPLNVSFTPSAPGAVLFSWNFGDGSTSTLQNPTHTYTTQGSFTVMLTVTDVHGCTNTYNRVNYVNISPPLPHFGANPREGCIPLLVQFTDSTVTSSYITNWTWTFGDGSPVSHLQNPSHNYPDTGTYLVSLFVVDSMGCTNTWTDTVFAGKHPIANFVADDTIGCLKFTVNFTDLSSPYADDWYWQFGDGGISHEQNPQHTYQDTGYFSVTLIVKHNGCPDTIKFTDYIYVKPPKATFTGTPQIGCSSPLFVQFTDQSIMPQTWNWTFGDGGSSTQQNPSHTYSSPGFYDVQLIVSNSNGCKDTMLVANYVQISDITPSFTQTTTEICEGNFIAFLSTSVVNTSVTNYHWDFGDGTTGSGYVVTHFYFNPGVFTVKLVITDALGCHDSITKTNWITVREKPRTNFTSDVQGGCNPLTVHFTDMTVAIAPATISSWAWDFGDGATSTVQNPVHTYSAVGTYTVKLKTVDSKGCDSTIIKLNYITTTFPIAFFTADSLKCFNDTVFFTNLSSGLHLSYAWNFGDGSPSDTAKNPWHLFNPPLTATFTVSLTVTDSVGCDSAYDRQIIISRPHSNFFANTVTANCPPLFVNFNDSSSADVVQWLWNFGDPGSGMNNFSQFQDPQHHYTTSGTFDVSLIVVNSDGCIDSLHLVDYITVNGPTGSFTYSPTSGCTPVDVTFTATSTSTTSFLWVFGDGNATTTTTGSAMHTYTDGGNFVPTLVITDSIHNCSLTITANDTITIVAGFADFGYTPTPPCTPSSTVVFSDSSQTSSPITSWLWDFGDGTTSTIQNPSHLYNVNGTYDVTLTIVAGPCTFVMTYDSVVSIFNPPAIDITITGTTTCYPPLQTTIKVDTAGINQTFASMVWDFGDGTSASNITNAIHVYAASGSYPVTVTITFPNGCQMVLSSTANISIYPVPTAGFSTDTNNVLAGDPIQFTDESLGVNLIYYWNFGDAVTGTDQNPIHAYDYAGTYDVIQIVSTPNGCSDTAYGTINVAEDILLPNVFTPNGDGVNDQFEIIARGFTDYNLLIYNRWGKKVWENTNPAVFWNGKVGKEDAADGVYYYVLEVTARGHDSKYNGTVTIIR
ncbi:MAG: PKD domain-containing protein [Bacteroidota bacterium]